MDVSVLVLSGCSPRSTTVFLKRAGWELACCSHRLSYGVRMFQRVGGRMEPIRVLLWVAAVSPISMRLVRSTLNYMDRVIYLYDVKEPLSLVRVRAWWRVCACPNGLLLGVNVKHPTLELLSKADEPLPHYARGLPAILTSLVRSIYN